MPTQTISSGTSLGVIRIEYAEDGDSPGVHHVSLCFAELYALASACIRACESFPEAYLGVGYVLYLARALELSRQSGAQHVIRFGSESLMGFRSAKPFSADDKRRAAVTWRMRRLDENMDVLSVSKHSPLELAIAIELKTAATVAGFGVLISALRRAYRGICSFAVDNAEIDAKIAAMRASAGESELLLEESRVARERIAADLRVASPTSNEGLTLTHVDASIEEG